MTAETLKGQVVLITGSKFKVMSALEIEQKNEWSIVGYWLADDGTEPEVPKPMHLLIEKNLLEIAAKS